jgi:hypothetical protein
METWAGFQDGSPFFKKMDEPAIHIITDAS